MAELYEILLNILIIFCIGIQLEIVQLWLIFCGHLPKYTRMYLIFLFWQEQQLRILTNEMFEKDCLKV